MKNSQFTMPRKRLYSLNNLINKKTLEKNDSQNSKLTKNIPQKVTMYLSDF